MENAYTTVGASCDCQSHRASVPTRIRRSFIGGERDVPSLPPRCNFLPPLGLRGPRGFIEWASLKRTLGLSGLRFRRVTRIEWYRKFFCTFESERIIKNPALHSFKECVHFFSDSIRTIRTGLSHSNFYFYNIRIKFMISSLHRLSNIRLLITIILF